MQQSDSLPNYLSLGSKILGSIGIFLIFIWLIGFTQTHLTSFGLSKSETSQLGLFDKKPVYMPSYDPTLPDTNRLIIPSIGVTTDIDEATLTDYESALKKGVWRVSDFGSPMDPTRPTILAAHRYGYLAWTYSYRKTNSFYNLPKLAVGDIVEIDYQKRKYTYEIYEKAEGEVITDYGADLILYTCKNLTGPVRVFVYAKLIQA